MSILIPISIFVLIAYTYTWVFHYRIVHQKLSLDTPNGRRLYLLGLPGPLIAAIITATIFGLLDRIQSGLLPVYVNTPWWILAAFVIPAIYILAVWINAGRAGKKPKQVFKRPTGGWGLLLIAQLYVVISEEIGWRGFALPMLVKSLGSIYGTILLGLVWALWHLPMFSVQTSNQKGALSRYVYSLVMWSFIMTVIVQGNQGNILPALVFHASANIAFFTMNVPEEADRISEVLLGLAAMGLAVTYLM